MPPVALFVGTFLVWIAAKGRFPDYYAFATTKATPQATPGSPSNPAMPGSAPLLKPPSALPSGNSLYGPGLGRDVQLNDLWQNIAGAAKSGEQLH